MSRRRSGRASCTVRRSASAGPRAKASSSRPSATVELERLIVSLDGRDRAIALLAGHLGLRPLEVRSVPWAALNGSTLMIGRAHTKKTARRTRTIDVPDTTLRELKEWRPRAGRPADAEPIIGDMTQNALKLWARRRLPAGVRLYDLAHSHGGRSPQPITAPVKRQAAESSATPVPSSR